jgi:hypothetical protein
MPSRFDRAVVEAAPHFVRAFSNPKAKVLYLAAAVALAWVVVQWPVPFVVGITLLPPAVLVVCCAVEYGIVGLVGAILLLLLIGGGGLLPYGW